MIVIDASAVLEIVLGTETGFEIEATISGEEINLAAPELLDLEVMQVLRRAVYQKIITERHADDAISLLNALPIIRYSHRPYLGHVWKRRHNHTAYDAAYLSLAEFLDVPLWTCDAKFGRSPETDVPIRFL